MVDGYSEYYDSSVLNKVSEEEIINGTFIVPDNIKVIGSRAFYYLKKLEKIIIPDSVEIIGTDAFHGCKNLREVILSKNLRIIRKSAFEGCYSLRYITIPQNIRLICEHAFKDDKNLHITLKTSLFKMKYECFSRNGSFEGKSLYIYDTKWDITLFFSYFDNKDLNIIRKRELKAKLQDMLNEKGIYSKDFFKEFPDANDFISSIVNKFDDMNDDYNYVDDLQKYIDDYLSKNSIVVKVFKQPTIFEGQTRSQIYDFINNYVPSEVNIKDINSIMDCSKALEDYPTYISGEFLSALSKKMNFNPKVKQIIKLLNNISKSTNGKNILKRLFFKKNENSDELSLDIESLNNMNSFIQNRLDELSQEIELFEFLKKIIRLYTEKRDEQVRILNSQTNKIEVIIEQQNDYSEIFDSSDNLASNTSVNSEIDKLNTSIISMVEQYKKVNILLSYDVVIYNKLTSLLKDKIPNLIANVALDNGINQRKDILEDIEAIKNVLSAMILGENNSKISNNDNIIELKLQVDEMIGQELPNVKINKK